MSSDNQGFAPYLGLVNGKTLHCPGCTRKLNPEESGFSSGLDEEQIVICPHCEKKFRARQESHTIYVIIV